VASSLQNVSRLAPIIAHAVGVFGDEQKAIHWLSTPLPLFQDRAPQDLLDTDEGVALVEQTLTRIEHNITSYVCEARRSSLPGYSCPFGR
jgi:putative toxin-antitoxin system antitoxin component (TIGR02293 family)